MLKKIIIILIVLGATVSLSNVYSQTAIKVSAKKSAKAKSIAPVRTNNTRYIENNGQKKKNKSKIVVTASDSCPSFAAYYSKSKAKREKMLRRKV